MAAPRIVPASWPAELPALDQLVDDMAAGIAFLPVRDPMADPRAQILTADGWKPLAVKPTTREA